MAVKRIQHHGDILEGKGIDRQRLSIDCRDMTVRMGRHVSAPCLA